MKTLVIILAILVGAAILIIITLIDTIAVLSDELKRCEESQRNTRVTTADIPSDHTKRNS